MNGKLVFTRKMYNLVTIYYTIQRRGIRRVIPNYFKKDSNCLLLEDKQLLSIANGRRVERYSNDNDFEKYETEFLLYKSQNKDKYKHRNGRKSRLNGKKNGTKNGKR